VDYTISRQEEGGNAYYTVRWSPFAKADKYEIVRTVPAIGGIAELYYMDEKGKLNIFCLQRSWYGGLRAVLRERCDPVLEKDPFRLSILVKWRDRIYYRWTATESLADMADVVFFLASDEGDDAVGGEDPDGEEDRVAPDHSGRFDRIYLKEIDSGKLTTI
jgi:hypothetical protein